MNPEATPPPLPEVKGVTPQYKTREHVGDIEPKTVRKRGRQS